MTDVAAAAADEPLSKREEEEESKGPGAARSAVIMVVVDCHGGRVIPTAEICDELVVSNTCLALEDKSIIYIKEDSLPLWIDTRVQMVCTHYIIMILLKSLLIIPFRCTILFMRSCCIIHLNYCNRHIVFVTQ